MQDADDRDDYRTAAQLGLTVAEVRERYPQATEYVALDGSPCWLVSELQDDPKL